MKSSELIEILQRKIEDYGDCEVVGNREVSIVYDEEMDEYSECEVIEKNLGCQTLLLTFKTPNFCSLLRNIKYHVWNEENFSPGRRRRLRPFPRQICRIIAIGATTGCRISETERGGPSVNRRLRRFVLTLVSK